MEDRWDKVKDLIPTLGLSGDVLTVFIGWMRWSFYSGAASLLDVRTKEDLQVARTDIENWIKENK